jgi:capsular polysaccharide biosynthesis protein
MIAPGERVRFGRLTLLETDRFRPELIRSVRDGFARPGAARRRVFVTRRSARGRRLREEEALLAALAPRGFEAVAMETLTFDQQVSLMGETEAIVAPHGAGLTNMIFCPPGATVVEIADADYPNPNFYALAAALVHDYRIVGARGIGSGHALDRDLSVDPDHVVAALGALGS